MPIYMKYDVFLYANQFAKMISGLSYRGAQQFLAGQIITDPNDRRALASALLKKLGFADITDGTSNVQLRPAGDDVSIGLLRLAALKVRRAAATAKPPLNLTDIGLLRFLSSDPVASQQDREALAFVVTEFFTLPKGI